MDINTFLTKIENFAKSNNMTANVVYSARFGANGIKVEYRFRNGLFLIRRTESIYLKESSETGKWNYWTVENHDGKQRIVGPGYGFPCAYMQTPISLELICEKFLKELANSARYYQPIG